MLLDEFWYSEKLHDESNGDLTIFICDGLCAPCFLCVWLASCAFRGTFLFSVTWMGRGYFIIAVGRGHGSSVVSMLLGSACHIGSADIKSRLSRSSFIF